MATSHNKRTAHRWRLLTMLLGGSFLALGSFWLVQVMHDQQEQGGTAKTSEPDYIVENFSFVRMGLNGQPKYVISGARLAHRPDVDISDVELPVLHSLTTEHPQLTVHAKRARVFHKENKVDLLGKVDAQRPASATSQALRIRTEAMTVLPDDEVLKTDQPVDVALGAMRMTGVGMEANNATQKLHVASRGQIVLPPRQPK